MTSLREDAKEVAIAIGYDFLIVAFLFSWIIAIVLALIETSLWVVFGVFLLGCLFFYTAIVISKKQTTNDSQQLKTTPNINSDSSIPPKEA